MSPRTAFCSLAARLEEACYGLDRPNAGLSRRQKVEHLRSGKALVPKVQVCVLFFSNARVVFQHPVPCLQDVVDRMNG